MSHGDADASDLDAGGAREVAVTMHALSTASRVLILDRLRAGPRTVGDLAALIGMEASAVSQQLRVLRHLGLVVGAARGRHVVYALHDDHVAELIEQAIFHTEHVRLGMAARPATGDVAALS